MYERDGWRERECERDGWRERERQRKTLEIWAAWRPWRERSVVEREREREGERDRERESVL